MARFQTRLDHLFQTVRDLDGGEYTYRHVATAIERLVGYKTSSSTLQELRSGVRSNPSMKHLHGLCAFFGVPIAYFFDEELAARVDAQLELAASLRDASVRDLAQQAEGLSAPTLQAITQIVHHARRIEGLPDVGDGPGTASDSGLPRRRHARGPRDRAATSRPPPSDNDVVL
jgi:transcriptional regulator with XRE-family HTH domain